MTEFSFNPETADEGSRIDVYLSKMLGETRSRVKSLVDDGRVFCAGVVVEKAGFTIKNSDLIKVYIDDIAPLSAEPQDIPINIVYQDSDLAVINKAQGMVTHPAEGTRDGTLVNALLYHIKDLSGINGVYRPGIVHRLDKNTSGLIVIAKTNAAHLSLAQQIAEKSAERIYLGLVTGNIIEDEGVIDLPIERSRTDRMKMAVSESGKNAVTYYKVAERFMDYTLVEFKLGTGRTHQIRVHMKHKNHVIAGDIEYGAKDKLWNWGQLLHACRLSFTHPSSGERMTFTAPLPDYFQKALEKLRNRNN